MPPFPNLKNTHNDRSTTQGCGRIHKITDVSYITQCQYTEIIQEIHREGVNIYALLEECHVISPCKILLLYLGEVLHLFHRSHLACFRLLFRLVEVFVTS